MEFDGVSAGGKIQGETSSQLYSEAKEKLLRSSSQVGIKKVF